MIDKCCLSQVQSWRHDMYVAGPPKIRGNIVDQCHIHFFTPISCYFEITRYWKISKGKLPE